MQPKCATNHRSLWWNAVRPIKSRAGDAAVVVLFTMLTAASTSCRTAGEPETGASQLADENTAIAQVLKALPGVYTPGAADVVVETNNTRAFQLKLDAIRKPDAQTIDLAYFIFDDYGHEHDYTTAVFMKELLAAALRGTKVRMLIDEGSGHKRRKDFIALKDQATQAGKGDHLEIAYFRPYELPEDSKLKNLEILAREVRSFAKSEQTINPISIMKLAKLLTDSNALAGALIGGETLEEHIRARLGLNANSASVAAAGTYGLKALLDTLKEVFAPHPQIDGTYSSFIASFLSKITDQDVSDAEAQALLDLLKRTHHKLLVVDGRQLIAGGRNIWDISHLEYDHSLRPGRKNDIDVDVAVADENLAKGALKTFDAYWQCAFDSNCKAGITVKRELGSPQTASGQANYSESNSVWTDRIEKSASQYAMKSEDLSETHKEVYNERLVGNNLPLSYVENHMYADPEAAFECAKSGSSCLLKAWTDLMDRTKSGQDILMVNAYFIMPSELVAAVVRALNRGVKVTVITNSDAVSDTPLVSLLSRLQIEALMTVLDEMQQSHLLRYIENHAHQQLHSKVSAIGDYLVVGSANADPRSAYLNTENAVVIGPGPSNVRWESSADSTVQAFLTQHPELKGPGDYASMAEAFLNMNQAVVAAHSQDGGATDVRFKKFNRQDLKSEIDSLAVKEDLKPIIKVLRTQFLISLRLGLGMTARDQPDAGRSNCPDGKAGKQKAGCEMRRWLYEHLFLQL